MFELLKKNLLERGYAVSCFATAEEAKQYLNQSIDQQTVGFGGSMTLAQLALYPLLAAHNEVYWHQGVTDPEESKALRTKASAADIYISSVNAIAETGEIINIDGVCNRIAAILYGHQKVYLIAGKNKLAENYDAALWRARNIAAPRNAKRLGRKTPCAIKAERCYNCNSPDRICRGLSVLWSKPMAEEMEIILIEENLGY